MRQISWNLNNLGNQDRALSAATVFPTGTVIIEKVAVGGDDTFAYTGTGSGIPANFDLATTSGFASVTFADILAGGSFAAKTVTEGALPSGWDFTNLTCDDPDGDTTVDLGTRTANIDLDGNETVTCTFENTKKGALKVVKSTVGGTGSFAYTSNAGSVGPLDTGSANPAMETISNVSAGNAYSVAETDPGASWDLTASSCTLEGGASTGTGGGGLSITDIVVEPGKTTTCTFENTKRGALKVVKTTVGALAPSTTPAMLALLVPWTQAAPIRRWKPSPMSLLAMLTAWLRLIQVLHGTWTDSYCELENGDPTGSGADTLNLSNIVVEPGKTTTCYFENTKRAMVTVNKTESGGLPLSQPFDFQIRQGADGDNSGTVIASGSSDVNTGVVVFSCEVGADPAICANDGGVAKLLHSMPTTTTNSVLRPRS